MNALNPDVAAIDPKPLRVGVYVDGMRQPAWVQSVLADIQASDLAQMVLVMQRAEPKPIATSHRRSDALYRLYGALDRRAFGAPSTAHGPAFRAIAEPSWPDASVQHDISDWVKELERISLSAADFDLSGRLCEPALEEIARYELDVAVSLVPNTTLVSDRPLARYGMWSYAFGKERHENIAPGFWEVLEGTPVTSAALQMSVERSGDQVALYRSFCSTDKYSVVRNSNFLWTSSAFVMRLLRQIHDQSLPSRDELLRAQLALPHSDRSRKRPQNKEMARMVAGHGARVIGDRLRHRLLPERWVMAYSLGPPSTPLHQYQPLDPPGQRMWADPFPVVHEGDYFLFFEEQDAPGDPAHIAVMGMRSDGTWGPPTKVLARDHHLSYPFIFTWEGCWYMIPESQATGRVELYRCTEFPHAWEADSILLEGLRPVDATLTQWGGLWWMFVNNAESRARNWEELHLYCAPNPRGPWSPHRGNPVRIDARNTRCAGRIFQSHGRLIRPSQDCGGRYGRAISFNEIVRLDDGCLEEREVGRLEPDWDPRVVGVHTYNSVDGLTVVDCLRRERRSLT